MRIRVSDPRVCACVRVLCVPATNTIKSDDGARSECVLSCGAAHMCVYILICNPPGVGVCVCVFASHVRALSPSPPPSPPACIVIMCAHRIHALRTRDRRSRLQTPATGLMEILSIIIVGRSVGPSYLLVTTTTHTLSGENWHTWRTCAA